MRYPDFIIKGERWKVRYFTQEPGGPVRAVVATKPVIKGENEVDWGPFSGTYGDEIVIQPPLLIQRDGCVHIPS